MKLPSLRARNTARPESCYNLANLLRASSRLQDILPFVAYTEGVAVEAAGAAAGAAAGGERGSGGDGGNGAAAQGAAELKAE